MKRTVSVASLNPAPYSANEDQEKTSTSAEPVVKANKKPRLYVLQFGLDFGNTEAPSMYPRSMQAQIETLFYMLKDLKWFPDEKLLIIFSNITVIEY